MSSETPETTHVIDLSALPEKVTDYAFDQYAERVYDQRQRWVDEYWDNDKVSFSTYEEQTVTIHASPTTCALYEACREKIDDIEREVKHDERHDFTMADVREMRATLQESI